MQQQHVNTVGHVRDHDKAADSSREPCHRRPRVVSRQVHHGTLTNTALAMKIRNLHLNKVKLLIITLFVTVFLLYDFGSSSNVIDQSEIPKDLFEDIDDDVAVDFNRVRKIDRTRSEKYVDTIENILSGEFSPLDEVVSPSPEYINLGFIMINLNQTTENLTDKFKHSVQKTFYSMLQYWSSAPLNLIVVTDERSVPSVASFLAGLLSREVGLRVITTRSRRWRRADSVPRVRVHFVNAMDIVQRNKPFVKRLQAVTLQYKENKTFVEDRYLADLFYIAPIYHLAFPALDSIIVIDITDLDFQDSVELLQEELRQVRGGRLIGLGLDLAPSYYLQLGRYRFLHPGSELGYPGPSQGFNTGVVLYNLAAMRRSQLYNSYLTPAMVNMLQEKYMYDFTLAEQVGILTPSCRCTKLTHRILGLVHQPVIQPPRPLLRAAVQVQQTDLHPVPEQQHGGALRGVPPLRAQGRGGGGPH